MRQPTTTLLIAATAATVIACNSESVDFTNPTKPTTNNLVNFRADMRGSNEVPVNTSPGSGLFTATLDTVTNVFTYDIIFSGLTTPVNNGHIHGPAAVGVNSGTTVNFNTLAAATFSFGQLSGAAHGQVTLTSGTQITATVNGDSLKKLLYAGLTYANIHTTQNGGGEIRGQITRQ